MQTLEGLDANKVHQKFYVPAVDTDVGMNKCVSFPAYRLLTRGLHTQLVQWQRFGDTNKRQIQVVHNKEEAS